MNIRKGFALLLIIFASFSLFINKGEAARSEPDPDVIIVVRWWLSEFNGRIIPTIIVETTAIHSHKLDEELNNNLYQIFTSPQCMSHLPREGWGNPPYKEILLEFTANDQLNNERMLDVVKAMGRAIASQRIAENIGIIDEHAGIVLWFPRVKSEEILFLECRQSFPEHEVTFLHHVSANDSIYPKSAL